MFLTSKMVDVKKCLKQAVIDALMGASRDRLSGFDVEKTVFDIENAFLDIENIVFDVENIALQCGKTTSKCFLFASSALAAATA